MTDFARPRSQRARRNLSFAVAFGLSPAAGELARRSARKRRAGAPGAEFFPVAAVSSAINAILNVNNAISKANRQEG